MAPPNPANASGSRLAQGLWGVAVALLAGILYWNTLLPGVGYHPDTARFQFVGKVLGTPHPTGYPLYVLLNHAFVELVPIGSIAFRANLLSAVLAVAALVVFFRVLLVLEVRPVAAASGALLLATTPTLWSQAIVAEVYALQTLFLALVLLFASRWHLTRRDRDLLAALAIYALAFTHHMTAITWAPALLLLLAATDRSALFRPRNIAWVLGWGLAAFASYAYVIWRSLDPRVAYLESRATNPGEVLRLLTGYRSQHNMFAFSLGEVLGERVPLFLRLLGQELSVFLLGSLAGFLLWRRAVLSGFFSLIAAGCLAFALNYDIPDIFVYFIPVYVILVLYLALGLEQLLRRVSPRAALAGGALAVLLPFASAALYVRTVDQSGNTGMARLTATILETVGRDAVIHVGVRHQTRYFQYYLLAEGLEAERRIFTVFGPERLPSYLQGGEIQLDYEPRRAPAGLALYVLAPEHRNRLAEQGFGTLTVSRDTLDFYLAFDRERGAGTTIGSLRERFPESSWLDAEEERLYILPGDDLPAPEALPLATELTQGRVETVGRTKVRMSETPVSSGVPLLVTGWAIDTARGLPAAGVLVELDGRPYPAAYGLSRPDQAERLGRPELAACGFRALLPARALMPGRHELALRVLSQDRRAWQRTPRAVSLVARERAEAP